MIPTLRRLDDRERYWGMTWPGWCAAAGGGAVVYGAVKLSPFGLKPTVTIVLVLLAFGAMIILGVSGQALSPSRHLKAIADYRRSPKRWTLTDKADKHGLVLASAPEEIPDPEELVVGLAHGAAIIADPHGSGPPGPGAINPEVPAEDAYDPEPG